MKARIEAVIFDFGGVVSQPLGPVLAGIEEEFGVPPGKLMELFYGGDLWTRAEVGRVSYTEYVAACQEGMCAYLDAETARQAWERWYTNFYRPHYMPGMLDIVESLQGKVRVAMLSNASEGMERRMHEQVGIGHLFDPLVNSATVGVAKPDERIFRHTLELLGLPAQACFFIDDTAVNIKAAERLGIRGHLFTDAGRLRESLAGEGVLP